MGGLILVLLVETLAQICRNRAWANWEGSQEPWVLGLGGEAYFQFCIFISIKLG